MAAAFPSIVLMVTGSYAPMRVQAASTRGITDPAHAESLSQATKPRALTLREALAALAYGTEA